VAGETRSTILIWVVAAALAVFAATRLLGGGAQPAPVRIDGASGAADPARVPGHSKPAADVYVHVAGAVRTPGLIRLPADARVAAALERAGGPLPRADLDLVNLAAKVQDGQQIVVPRAGAAGTAAGAPTAGGSVVGGLATIPGAKVHLSTATIEQLDGVDGIGPTLAQRIVEYRDAHGGFRSVDELASVDGIGEKRLATLRDALQP
jgi:competence protein ComEA